MRRPAGRQGIPRAVFIVMALGEVNRKNQMVIRPAGHKPPPVREVRGEIAKPDRA
jgi:hypothetical protein